ncbi:hypothetical protein RJT34_01243 [Clitoria ternatea]|uniref:aminobutyraldehyde dehydrogenase n=1 Tax=Clitoria ternatea TaxID=43366 RepID=A0AAN9KJB4_CLITE
MLPSLKLLERAYTGQITEKKNELGKLEAIDCGKSLDEALADLDDVIGCSNYYAELAEGLDAKQKAPVSLPMANFKSYVLKEPIEVVALITPCHLHWPLCMFSSTIANLIICHVGLSCWHVIYNFKTCLELAELCGEVGLPPGVLNIVIGLGHEAGAPLASHPDVDKPVSLELGGKSPIIVFEDVDLDKIAESTALAASLQIESIATEFLNRLVKWAKSIKISDPLEEGCRLGTTVSEGQDIMDYQSMN